jgi:hypothetical protein
VQDVDDFWKAQPFDLKLPGAKVNIQSNCNLCFLKGYGIKQSLVRANPYLADWWAAQEDRIGARFRTDQPSYADMKVIATDQPVFDFGDDESLSCFCGD